MISLASLLPLMPLDPLPAWIAAAAIASLFAQAAVSKFTDLALLEQHLFAYGLPQRGLALAARLLPAAELSLALALLTPWRSAAALAAAAVLLVYAALMGHHRWHGHRLDCGCGGEPLAVSWPLVARNLALTGLALLAAMPTTARTLGLVDLALVLASLALATLLYAAFHQILRLGPHQRSTPYPLPR